MTRKIENLRKKIIESDFKKLCNLYFKIIFILKKCFWKFLLYIASYCQLKVD